MDRLSARTWLADERERVVGTVLIALGAGALLATYLSVSTDKYLVSELARVAAGGVGSVELLVAGATALLFGDLLDEWDKLDRIEAALAGKPSARNRRAGSIPPAVRAPVGAALAALAISAIVIVLAWNRAASVHDPRLGLRALSVAVVGLVAGAVGMAVATLALVRRIRLRASLLLAPWLLADLEARVPVELHRRRDQIVAADRVVVGGVLVRYHLPGCAVLTSGGPYQEISVTDVPAGARPCGLCLEQREVTVVGTRVEEYAP